MLQKLGFNCRAGLFCRKKYNKINLVSSEFDGLNLDDLEAQFKSDLKDVEADRKQGRYSAACYLVPSFQNPYGTVLSEGFFTEILIIGKFRKVHTHS